MSGGRLGFSQWFRKECGDYPRRDMSVSLERMGKVERARNTWFGLYLWERKRSKIRNGVIW